MIFINFFEVNLKVNYKHIIIFILKINLIINIIYNSLAPFKDLDAVLKIKFIDAIIIDLLSFIYAEDYYFYYKVASHCLK
jgi:hypothetical protein